MKALILAAGMGTRLRPHTDTKPKCLVPLGGKPLLTYQLEAFSRLGVEPVVVVGGYRAECLEGLGPQVLLNPDYQTTNMVHTLFCAQSEMTDDLILAYGDIIFEDRVLKALMESPAEVSVVVDRGWKALWEVRMDNPLADAETLKIGPDGNIAEIGKKPTSYDDIEGQYIGLIKFSRAALPKILHWYQGMDRAREYDGKSFEQMYMTSFLQSVGENVYPLTPVWIDHGWLEVDSVEDLRAYESEGFERTGLFTHRR